MSLMIVKKILSFAASIISLLIINFFLVNHSSSDENNSKQYSNDEGVLSIMYHRFNESKYPSTNIQMDVFEKHIEFIKKTDFLNNPLITIVVSSLIMVGVYKVGIVVFKRKPKTS